MHLDYPKQFTVAGWKAREKQLKLTKTGMAKPITDLEKAFSALNVALASGDTVAPKLRVAIDAASAAETALSTYLRAKDDPTVSSALATAARGLRDIAYELRQFDPNDHRGLSTPVDRFNHRIDDLGPMIPVSSKPDAVVEEDDVEDDGPREKIEPLLYPKPYTDPEWKKLEKSIKLSNTGVGKLLRDLESAVGKVNAELAGSADKAKLSTLRKAAAAAAGKAQEKVRALAGKAKSGTEAFKKLDALADNLGDYESRLKAWDVDDHRGLAWATDDFNFRAKPRR